MTKNRDPCMYRDIEIKDYWRGYRKMGIEDS